MRHWGIGAGVALGAALGLALGCAHWPLDPVHIRNQLSAALGPVDALSGATLTLLPRPTLRLRNLRWRAPDGAVAARSDEAEVTLRFDRLLVGGFVPVGLTLRGAEMQLNLDAALPAISGLTAAPVSRLVVQRGTVDVISAQRGWSSRLDLADAELNWSSPGGPLRLSATGRWRSQPVEATAEIDSPLAAAHGGPSAVRASLDAPLAQLRFAGDWSSAGELDGALYRGQTSALIPSLARFARWIGEPVPGPAPAGLEMEAHVVADMKQVRLADVTLALGGQSFEGALDVLRTEAGVSVSGTMAADSLDLEPLIGPPPTLVDGSGEWSATAALPQPTPKIDLDLRVSATRAVWRGHAIDNAAAAVSQRDGRLSIKLLEAGLAHGSLSGEMSVEAKPGTCESRLALTLEDADLGVLLAEFGERNFSGEGSLKISAHAHGRSPADIVASADGDGTLDIVDGALRSLNFEEALRRGQRKLIDVAHDMNAGATRFGAAHGRLEISNGEARFVDAQTLAPGVSLTLTGAIDLSGQAWRARLAARESAEDGKPTPDGARIDFALYGPWVGPVFTPILPPAD